MKRKLAEDERQNQQTLKRKAEIEAAVEAASNVLPPAAKKLGMISGVVGNANVAHPEALDDGTIIEGSGKKTLYTPSGVSKWNQCKYECCFCKRTTMSRSSMTSHIHNTHKLPIKEYKEANYPDIGT